MLQKKKQLLITFKILLLLGSLGRRDFAYTFPTPPGTTRTTCHNKIDNSGAVAASTTFPLHHQYSRTLCYAMKRPLLDQIASTLFRLETDRVANAAEIDDQGRTGEPMAWSEPTSLANTFSNIMAKQGYGFKQWVADIVAGEYDEDQIRARIQDMVDSNDIVMFSFTTCPFCRRAKDALDDRGESYIVLELDGEGENDGNALRSMLGKITRRTSVPCIFVKGTCIGGCNDGPGLLPLLGDGEFDALLGKTTTA